MSHRQQGFSAPPAPARSRGRRAVVAGLALLLAGCSSGSKAATGLRGLRYCEILLVRPTTANATAVVYNTYPLNACPASKWDALDAKTVATQQGVPLALPNGPRYWLMDSIEKATAGARVVKVFGGIAMIREATVALGPLAAVATKYVPHHVDRATVFAFDAGSLVYELHDPHGATYVMQSWSQQVDHTLDQAGLSTLGSTLKLPSGWTYQPRTLTAPLRIVTTTSDATVIQDDLMNSYSLETAG